MTEKYPQTTDRVVRRITDAFYFLDLPEQSASILGRTVLDMLAEAGTLPENSSKLDVVLARNPFVQTSRRPAEEAARKLMQVANVDYDFWQATMAAMAFDPALSIEDQLQQSIVNGSGAQGIATDEAMGNTPWPTSEVVEFPVKGKIVRTPYEL